MISLPKYFTILDITIPGLYFVLRGKKIIYIGRSSNIMRRLHGSHDILSFKKFDKIRFIPCPIRLLDRYEKRWILRFRPKYNFRHLYVMMGPTIGYSNKRKKVPINLKKVLSLTRKQK